jgi:hypothetical protein
MALWHGRAMDVGSALQQGMNAQSVRLVLVLVFVLFCLF